MSTGKTFGRFSWLSAHSVLSVSLILIWSPCPSVVSVKAPPDNLFNVLAEHLKIALCKGLQNVAYTHKYMQCRCPILFYFGSENDYLNLENMSTGGP